jgi:hypothetical protein
MDHFPFFLPYFPQTARTLSDELEELLTDSKRSALWKQALALIRQSYDVNYLHEPGWDMSGEERFSAVVAQLIQSIPGVSALRWCFGLEVYLRAALEDLLEAEAIDADAPYGPHGLKLYRCAPGNPIWLRPNLDPANFSEATPAQRDEVANYIDKVRRGIKPGPDKGQTSMPSDFLDQIRDAYTTLTNAPDAKPAAITVEDVLHAMKTHPSTSSFERWLKRLTGKTWKQFKKSL